MALPVSDRRADPRPGATSDRRRSRWREFRHAYPGIVASMAFAALILLAMDGVLLVERWRYDREAIRLRDGMSDVERRKTDALVESEQNKMLMTVALMRRQAVGDQRLHLSISVDSGRMTLEREGARLRDMRIAVGPERVVGTPPDTVHMAVPRGARTVERVLGADDGWAVPGWVYADRRLPEPADRVVRGALGPSAVLLSGGTVIYSPASAGPLNDASYVLPGAIRVSAADLAAVVPNLRPGTTVYFY